MSEESPHPQSLRPAVLIEKTEATEQYFFSPSGKRYRSQKEALAAMEDDVSDAPPPPRKRQATCPGVLDQGSTGVESELTESSESDEGSGSPRAGAKPQRLYSLAGGRTEHAQAPAKSRSGSRPSKHPAGAKPRHTPGVEPEAGPHATLAPALHTGQLRTGGGGLGVGGAGVHTTASHRAGGGGGGAKVGTSSLGGLPRPAGVLPPGGVPPPLPPCCETGARTRSANGSEAWHPAPPHSLLHRHRDADSQPLFPCALQRGRSRRQRSRQQCGLDMLADIASLDELPPPAAGGWPLLPPGGPKGLMCGAGSGAGAAGRRDLSGMHASIHRYQQAQEQLRQQARQSQQQQQQQQASLGLEGGLLLQLQLHSQQQQQLLADTHPSQQQQQQQQRQHSGEAHNSTQLPPPPADHAHHPPTGPSPAEPPQQPVPHASRPASQQAQQDSILQQEFLLQLLCQRQKGPMGGNAPPPRPPQPPPPPPRPTAPTPAHTPTPAPVPLPPTPAPAPIPPCAPSAHTFTAVEQPPLPGPRDADQRGATRITEGSTPAAAGPGPPAAAAAEPAGACDTGTADTATLGGGCPPPITPLPADGASPPDTGTELGPRPSHGTAAVHGPNPRSGAPPPSACLPTQPGPGLGPGGGGSLDGPTATTHTGAPALPHTAACGGPALPPAARLQPGGKRCSVSGHEALRHGDEEQHRSEGVSSSGVPGRSQTPWGAGAVHASANACPASLPQPSTPVIVSSPTPQPTTSLGHPARPPGQANAERAPGRGAPSSCSEAVPALPASPQPARVATQGGTAASLQAAAAATAAALHTAVAPMAATETVAAAAAAAAAAADLEGAAAAAAAAAAAVNSSKPCNGHLPGKAACVRELLLSAAPSVSGLESVVGQLRGGVGGGDSRVDAVANALQALRQALAQLGASDSGSSHAV
ncbi:MAG: hypothetical protein WDW38_010003 [Sanguina aurantia]